MGKRKRDLEAAETVNGEAKKSHTTPPKVVDGQATVVQIVTGSYERVLHGFQATISNLNAHDASVQYVDTFLFNAHSSAIRCLALSPLPDESTLSENMRVTLASGGTDERINLYSLSVSPLAESDRLPSVPTLAGNKILENPANRELGSLLQHSSSITALYFPTRSKLLAAAEDNTISISRTKDFEVVSTIKAPRPKVQGRPSGDTAPPGASPMGINDFAVHPSMKLMVSVGKGEKCMRLWNLVTGKKAGVLNFNREILESVKEGKYSSGEGKRIEWSPKGEEFAVAFERGVIIYGVDSVPSRRVLPMPLTKVHQMRYIQVGSGNKATTFLAVSTEDGRIVFYRASTAGENEQVAEKTADITDATQIAQLGGKAAGVSGRIKDFEILSVRGTDQLLAVTASSDGAVRLWTFKSADLSHSGSAKSDASQQQIGHLVGTYESGNRITCLKAYVMLPADQSEAALDGLTEAEDEDESSEESEGSV